MQSCVAAARRSNVADEHLVPLTVQVQQRDNSRPFDATKKSVGMYKNIDGSQQVKWTLLLARVPVSRPGESRVSRSVDLSICLGNPNWLRLHDSTRNPLKVLVESVYVRQCR